jgi:hypothetical protein
MTCPTYSPFIISCALLVGSSWENTFDFNGNKIDDIQDFVLSGVCMEVMVRIGRNVDWELKNLLDVSAISQQFPSIL